MSDITNVAITGSNEGALKAINQVDAELNSFVSRSTARLRQLQAAMAAATAPKNISGAGFAAVNTQMGKTLTLGTQLNQIFTKMSSTLSGGIGMGVTIAGFVALEQVFAKGIKKAEQFQTAQLSIASALQSGFNITGKNGKALDPATQYQVALDKAKKVNKELIQLSRENILTYEEQLGSFRAAIMPGSRKGLGVEDIVKTSNLIAVAAKAIGASGEQVSNSVRILMGGGINIQRTMIGKALGIQPGQIEGLRGADFTKFIEERLKGFKAGQEEFKGSIEAILTTLTSEVDVFASKVGSKFMSKSSGGFKQMGDLLQGEKGEKLATGLADTFSSVFKALNAIVQSPAIPVFTKFLQFLAGIADKIIIGAVLLKLASIMQGIVGTVSGAIQMYQKFTATLKGTAVATEGLCAAQAACAKSGVAAGLGGTGAGATRGVRGALAAEQAAAGALGFTPIAAPGRSAGMRLTAAGINAEAQAAYFSNYEKALVAGTLPTTYPGMAAWTKNMKAGTSAAAIERQMASLAAQKTAVDAGTAMPIWMGGPSTTAYQTELARRSGFSGSGRALSGAALASSRTAAARAMEAEIMAARGAVTGAQMMMPGPMASGAWPAAMLPGRQGFMERLLGPNAYSKGSAMLRGGGGIGGMALRGIPSFIGAYGVSQALQAMERGNPQSNTAAAFSSIGRGAAYGGAAGMTMGGPLGAGIGAAIGAVAMPLKESFEILGKTAEETAAKLASIEETAPQGKKVSDLKAQIADINKQIAARDAGLTGYQTGTREKPRTLLQKLFFDPFAWQGDKPGGEGITYKPITGTAKELREKREQLEAQTQMAKAASQAHIEAAAEYTAKEWKAKEDVANKRIGVYQSGAFFGQNMSGRILSAQKEAEMSRLGGLAAESATAPPGAETMPIDPKLRKLVTGIMEASKEYDPYKIQEAVIRVQKEQYKRTIDKQFASKAITMEMEREQLKQGSAYTLDEQYREGRTKTTIAARKMFESGELSEPEYKQYLTKTTAQFERSFNRPMKQLQGVMEALNLGSSAQNAVEIIKLTWETAKRKLDELGEVFNIPKKQLNSLRAQQALEFQGQLRWAEFQKSHRDYGKGNAAILGEEASKEKLATLQTQGAIQEAEGSPLTAYVTGIREKIEQARGTMNASDRARYKKALLKNIPEDFQRMGVDQEIAIERGQLEVPKAVLGLKQANLGVRQAEFNLGQFPMQRAQAQFGLSQAVLSRDMLGVSAPQNQAAFGMIEQKVRAERFGAMSAGQMESLANRKVTQEIEGANLAVEAAKNNIEASRMQFEAARINLEAAQIGQKEAELGVGAAKNMKLPSKEDFERDRASAIAAVSKLTGIPESSLEKGGKGTENNLAIGPFNISGGTEFTDTEVKQIAQKVYDEICTRMKRKPS